ncbi:cytochrome P450 [Streptomyces sp. CC219B]|uniref:cytochrome P450 n=1 Tax=Streptomyces sp. CC219B TaxID=3044574 RepID=UPI0024A84173|nr:cytochrome P450 [Streptomyces sp. CC219B]
MTPTPTFAATEPCLDEINLVDPDLYAYGDPFASWRVLRREDPVYWHRPTDLPGFWALTRYDDIRAVYRDAETFSSANGILLRPESDGPDPGGGRTLALTDPPRHQQIRALVAHWFDTRSVRRLEADMRSTVRDVIMRAAEQETCDFVTEIAARLPLYVICGLMGVPDSERELVFALTKQAFGAQDARSRSVAHQEIMRYFIGLMFERRQNPSDDLVSLLVTGMVDGRPLIDEDVLLNCDNLLVGGTENVRLAVSGGMQAFLEHPDQWRRLGTDPGLLPTAVEEVLRWTSSATHIMRTATRPVELHGRTIEAGDRVTLWNPSANRDERVFDAPDRFDITRRPNRHIALGSGEHFCIGALLARAEMKVLFSELLDCLDTIEPAGPAIRLSSIVVNGLERLPVRMVSKQP